MTDNPFARAVIVGGSGAVGSLLARALTGAGTPHLLLVDRRPPSAPPSDAATSAVGDILRPSDEILRWIRSSDLVVLATPEPVAIESLNCLLPAMKPDSLLVDTLSVKGRYALALTARPTRTELLGVNPMFAPELGFEGRSVVAVPYRGGPQSDAFLGLITAWGSDVVCLSAESHDQACAALQIVTHASVLAFGMALAAGGYDIAAAERIMPPPHRTMLALLARIVAADPEVYRDIQSANPAAARARAGLVDAHRRLERIVASDDPEPFHRLIGELREVLRGAQTDYAGLCARLFEIKPAP